MTLADFKVIGDAMRLEFKKARLRMSSLEKRQGWYSGIVSAWLRGVIALPAERFFELLAALDVGTHEFFLTVYREVEVPERTDREQFELPIDGENLTTCLRLHLRHAIRSRGFKQNEVERKVGWTPRYLSTLLAGRRPLSLLHCLAVIRAIDLTPAEFFLSLDCERASTEETEPEAETEPPNSQT